MPSPEVSFDALHARLAAHGQDHVLRWWPELDAGQRRRLAEQIESIDLDLLSRLWGEIESGAGTLAAIPGGLRAAAVQRLPTSVEDWQREQQAAAVGEAALRAGQVGVLLVAGGQGSRLGHPGPKGTYSIGPVTDRTLFQIHAEKVLALSRRYETPLLLCIMTSPENDEETRRFFDDRGRFGLEESQLAFLVQGTMPAMDSRTGKLLLTTKGQLAASPNGHGGVVEALANAGQLAGFQRRGIRQLFYFQVDNPLVKVADPAFLGQHLQAEAEMSLKVVAKISPDERLGVVTQRAAEIRVIEYSDLAAEQAQRRNTEGELELWAGSIAVHIFEVSFLERLAASSALPYHQAQKAVPFIDENGQCVRPDMGKPNAIKFERFVFDALPLARKALVVETSRREEFEPLKNASGDNSPATARRALSDLYADWLQRAGVAVATGVPIEISPLYALDAEELRSKVQGIMTPLGVVQAFVSAINTHDVRRLAALMTDDHRFTDSLGQVVTGRKAMEAAWSGYFAMVPDYRLVAKQWLYDGQVIVLLGTASGTCSSDGSLDPDGAWATPAACRAVVRAGLVAEWQVYADNEPIRQRRRLGAEPSQSHESKTPQN